MYVISEKGLKQQERLMGPQEELTATGIHISYHATPGKQHIAWKSWQPEQRHYRASLLCIPGSHLGLEVYEPLAFWLAEQGVAIHALSFANHGIGWGYSWDMEVPSRGPMTLHQATRHIGLVMEELKDQVVLVGAGLGGIAAQLYAQQPPEQVIGLILLGSCLPSLARDVWPSPPPGRAMKPIPAPTTAALAGWLGHDANERDIETLAALMKEESLLIEPGELENVPGEYMRPALVVAGEHDSYVRPPILQVTADYYKTELHILPGAAHVLTWGKYWPECADRLLTFVNGTTYD